jgi:hypothetical protein
MAGGGIGIFLGPAAWVFIIIHSRCHRSGCINGFRSRVASWHAFMIVHDTRVPDLGLLPFDNA